MKLINASLNFLYVRHVLFNVRKNALFAHLDQFLYIIHIEPTHALNNRIVFFDSGLETFKFFIYRLDLENHFRMQFGVTKNAFDTLDNIPCCRFHIVL
jgi:hypothetical protein